MAKILLCITIIGILILLGFVIYFSLLKMPKKGNTKIIFKFVLCKIMKIEYESEYNDSSKEETIIHNQ